jgi:hypothetical protein
MNRLKIVIGLTITTVIMGALNIANSMDNPIYHLKFSVRSAGVEVYLNDILVFSEDKPGVIESEKPVPESVVDGRNTLRVRVTPPDGKTHFGSEAAVSVSLLVREKGAPTDKYEAISDLLIAPGRERNEVLSSSHGLPRNSDPELVRLTEGELIAQRHVAIKSPYPRWQWQDGVIIENDEESYSSLVNEYAKIYEALKSEDMKRIKSLYGEAAKEYAAAYHYTDADHGHRIMETGSYAGKREWILGDIQHNFDKNVSFHLDVYANGKLARLVDERGEETFIVYFNTDLKVLSFQKFGFYKNKGGSWIMIR